MRGPVGKVEKQDVIRLRAMNKNQNYGVAPANRTGAIMTSLSTQSKGFISDDRGV